MRPASPLDENSVAFKSLAIVVVVLLHMALYQALCYYQRPSSMTLSQDDGLRVQYIESIQSRISGILSVPDEQGSAEATRPHLPAAQDGPAETTREGSKPIQAFVMASTPAAPASSDGPLMLEWTENTKAGPDYRPNVLGDRISASLVTSDPGRFRMRKQLSGKDVIEGSAQFLGLWPPGYTTDPCPKIERNIGGLMSDTRPAARELLNEELRRQKAYCR